MEKHKWSYDEDIFRCSRCGQEWVDVETFKNVDAMSCPIYLEREGDFIIEYYKEYDRFEDWMPYTYVENIRQGIEFCRDMFEGEKIRLRDLNNNEEIYDF